ncbi:four helix bundle protein [Mesonia aquimarina]|uniref:four helix bundle protein n=1 Tax=Mesonia aquimarina TaxID=1504967 RepID=UPI000EF5EDBE|nr:four helix bundle protein [Mesonia aquimarina]
MSLTYKELDVYKISFNLFIKTHQFSHRLPKHELYELGSQIRRAADSVNSNIVEGYGRNRYKLDFIRFLVYAHSSNDELINHLKKVEILYPELEPEAIELIDNYNKLGKKINKFKKYVESNWR